MRYIVRRSDILEKYFNVTAIVDGLVTKNEYFIKKDDDGTYSMFYTKINSLTHRVINRSSMEELLSYIELTEGGM